MKTKLLRAEEELKSLSRRRMAAEGLRVQIRMLEADAVGIGGCDATRPKVDEPRRKGGIRTTLEERTLLEEKEKALSTWVQHVEKVLKSLPYMQEQILRGWYCSGMLPGDATLQLEKELHVSRATIYNLRERALKEFASRFGLL